MTNITYGTPGSMVMKRFPYRFQAKTWLLLNGYIFNDGKATYTHINNGTSATINTRRIYGN